MGFNGDSMGFHGIGDGITLWKTFTVCKLENGPVEIVDLPSYFSHGGSFQFVMWSRLPGRVYGGFQSIMGDLQARWMVTISWKSNFHG